MRINCLGLCKVRWTENGQFVKNDKTTIYSAEREHQRGVGWFWIKDFIILSWHVGLILIVCFL